MTKRTLIEEGTEFKGTLTSKCPIEVNGAVEGDINGPSVSIAPSGVFSGKVKVEEFRSEGDIFGQIEATSVQLGGKVRDKTVIKAASLEVKLSTEGKPLTFGECELAIGDEPNKEQALANALAKKSPAPTPAKTTVPVAKPDSKDAKAEAKSEEPAEGGGRRRKSTLPPPPSNA
jgi:cytoskeletal protein CcmA (bactofilin family)